MHPTNRNPGRNQESEEDAFEGALNLSHNSIFNEQCPTKVEPKAYFFKVTGGYRGLPQVTAQLPFHGYFSTLLETRLPWFSINLPSLSGTKKPRAD
jgi:hypothetical protein